MDIPTQLLSEISSGGVVLFLGAGGSVGASHPANRRIPNAQELSDSIADQFLDSSFHGRQLSENAEYAISESSLYKVQAWIAEVFREFNPAKFHQLIPTFAWKAIASTNYDSILEQAYQSVDARLQNPIVFTKDSQRVEDRLQQSNDIQYLKLHGSINDINDPDTPLILTPDQYVTHRKNRENLFRRLQEWWVSSPFLFVGD